MWILSIIGRCARLFQDQHAADPSPADTDEFDPYTADCCRKLKRTPVFHERRNGR